VWKSRCELPDLVGGGVLRFGDDLSRLALVPRRVELSAHVRLREAVNAPLAAADRARRRGTRMVWLHHRPARRARRPHSLGTMELRARIPSGPLERKWEKHCFDMKLVNPANKRRYAVIVVGTGLAGGAAAASLSELGYRVKAFC